MARGPSKKTLTELEQRWREAWPRALQLWSRYTRLREPFWAHTEEQEAAEGISLSFAQIRLNDHMIAISLRQVEKLKLGGYALEVLAHEIGHHVYTPGNLLDNAISLSRARRGLPGVEDQAPMVLNLYEDLLINDRLVRFHNLRIAEVYQALTKVKKGKGGSRLWSLYMRAYELLWGLEPQSLGGEKLEGPSEGDAQLMARLVRVYANDWLDGAGGFAALVFPYIDKAEPPQFGLIMDAANAGAGAAAPAGLTEGDDGLVLHPSLDPRVVGSNPLLTADGQDVTGRSSAMSPIGNSKGQCRTPFEYGQILKAMGLNLSEAEVAATYYRERAVPFLIPFPCKEAPLSDEPLMEGLDPWDTGSPLEEVDWLQSVLISPRVFPGLTTVQRSWGRMSGKNRNPEPLDLDLYVDCSGSMPNPRVALSHIALAGAIVMLSALRAGSRVQATLWSSAGQFDTTRGFVRDEKLLFAVLTGYFGGGTAFPNHILRDTYQGRTERDRPVHILHLSDEGMDTMNQPDEKGNPGMSIAGMALEKARGGGTMVLNMSEGYLKQPFFVEAARMGWNIFPVSDWQGMVDFAREFARLKYSDQKGSRSKVRRP